MTCGEREKAAEIEPMFQYEFNQLAVYENGRTPCLLTEEQYRRAKACVNACAGIDTAVLESGNMPMQLAGILAVVQQRDELLAALEGLYNHTKSNHNIAGLNTAARNAIASVKGQS